MSPRLPRISLAGPEQKVAAVIAGTIVAGLLMDLAGGVVSAPQSRVGGGVVARAQFCPPALRGGEANVTLAVGGSPGSAESIALEPGGKNEIPKERILLERPPDGAPTDVVGYGADTIAQAMSNFAAPVRGAGAAACAQSAAGRWYFAEGSSTLGSDQRIIVYNPFPSEAVIRVTFFTPSGPNQKANLVRQAIPPQSSVGFAVNEYLLRQRILGAAVVAVRGRVVAWRALLGRPEGRPRGGQFSLGATAPATTWYFPEGGVGDGFEERISVLNPSSEEAVLSISLAAADGAVQPPKLVEIAIPARTVKSFSLTESVGGRQSQLGGAGAIVTSINDVGVVAERTVWYSGRDISGVASEIGASRSARRWWVGPATTAPETDSLMLLNPGDEAATVSVVLLRPDGEPLSPEAIRTVTVPPFARVRVTLAAITKGRPMAALVESTSGIVVERVSYSAAAEDVASVMGVPLD